MKTKRTFFLYSLFTLLLIVAGCGTGSAVNSSDNDSDGSATENGSDADYELELISFLPVNHPLTEEVVPMWIDKIESGTNGAISIDWLGGPETMPTDNQYDAVRNGLVDVGFLSTAYFVSMMPEAQSMYVSPYTAEEEREHGYFDYLTDRFDQQGVSYLGRWQSGQFYIWSNKDVESIDELSGTSFRSNPMYHDVQKELGMTPVNVAPGDVYTSLERGMVDGFFFTLNGPRVDGWTEVTNYIINEPIMEVSSTIVMNPDVLGGLPDDLQNQVKELTAEFETDLKEYMDKEIEEEWEALESEGVEKIELTDDETDKLQQLVTDVKWNTLKETVDEDQFNKLEELLLIN